MSGSGNSPARNELLELAALYALDALADKEREDFERELAGNPELQAEVDALREVAGSLGAAAEEASPPAGLGDRLMAAAKAARPPKPGVAHDRDGLLILKSGEMGWKPHPELEGVMTKVLHFDRETGLMTSLVSYKAGTVYPAHRHSTDEELFVVQGEVEVHGVRMGPGDYCRATPDSVHRPSLAHTDAVILVRNSVHDQVQ